MERVSQALKRELIIMPIATFLGDIPILFLIGVTLDPMLETKEAE